MWFVSRNYTTQSQAKVYRAYKGEKKLKVKGHSTLATVIFFVNFMDLYTAPVWFCTYFIHGYSIYTLTGVKRISDMAINQRRFVLPHYPASNPGRCGVYF